MKTYKLKSIKKIESNSKKYDIQVSKNMNFFANNILVHNSLIILFYYKKRMEWIIASRGSFISEQSIEAKKMIDISVYDKLNTEYTYLFEIIYPENRIVVNYGNKRELILLGKLNTLTGVEYDYHSMFIRYSNIFTVVKKYKINDVNHLSVLKKLEEDNREGFVVRFPNLRVKVKFSEYVRLHGILTNVSNLTVWEHLMNNYDFDSLLDRVPDEFYDWLKKTTNSLQLEFNNIERLALKEFIRIYYINGIVERKEFAMESIKTEYRSILFKIYDKKSYNEIIWKSIRPIYSKPFKDGY